MSDTPEVKAKGFDVSGVEMAALYTALLKRYHRMRGLFVLGPDARTVIVEAFAKTNGYVYFDGNVFGGFSLDVKNKVAYRVEHYDAAVGGIGSFRNVFMELKLGKVGCPHCGKL